MGVFVWFHTWQQVWIQLAGWFLYSICGTHQENKSHFCSLIKLDLWLTSTVNAPHAIHHKWHLINCSALQHMEISWISTWHWLLELQRLKKKKKRFQCFFYSWRSFWRVKSSDMVMGWTLCLVTHCWHLLSVNNHCHTSHRPHASAAVRGVLIKPLATHFCMQWTNLVFILSSLPRLYTVAKAAYFRVYRRYNE